MLSGMIDRDNQESHGIYVYSKSKGESFMRIKLGKRLMMVSLVLALCFAATSNVFAMSDSKGQAAAIYKANIVDFDANPNADPIGKIVKHKKDKNVKPQIA